MLVLVLMFAGLGTHRVMLSLLEITSRVSLVL